MIQKKNLILLLSAIMLGSLGLAQNSKKEQPTLSLGGALRFNYNISSWKDGQKDRLGDFGFDVFRLNAKAKYKKLKIDAEYRFYSKDFGGSMLKHGWFAYDFSPNNTLQLGLTQVPFGITPYNSNSFFFSINYYIGLEDDYDMGLKFSHKGAQWEYDLAFFKNAEELRFGSNSDLSDSRYAYDVASIDLDGDGNLNLRNKEINQLNGQLKYLFGDKIKQKIGASIEYGGLYNLDTEEIGYHYALAAHYELKLERFETKAQISTYKYEAKNPEGQPSDKIALSAFGAPYLIAAKATSYTLGLSYALPVDWGIISQIKLYNDFGYLDKSVDEFDDSIMNTIGMMLTVGQIYTYIDVATGKNQAWLGSNWTNAFASGNTKEGWETRFNINIGYYF